MEPDHNTNPETHPVNGEQGAEQPEAKGAKTRGKRSLRYIVIGTLVVWSVVSSVLLAVLLNQVGYLGRNPQSNGSAQGEARLSAAAPSQTIYEKYQEIIDQLARLNSETLEDSTLEERIGQLSQEIHDLRVLNPYYRLKEIRASFIPAGVPDVYGQKLGISFDGVQDAINRTRILGATYGKEGKKIVLAGGDLERYIGIGSQIACEYCCEATTLVREDGVAACGCAHSIMMRGLAAYLIKSHPELSDARILDELYRWKVAFFPRQTLANKLSEMEKAGEPGIKEVLQEFPALLPDMVGGC